MLGRRSATWTDSLTCLILGEAAGERREDSDPHPRRANDNDSLEEYSLVSNQRSRSVAEPPTRAVEFTLPGSNTLRTTRGATEAHSREGEEEGHYREPAQADLGTEGQGQELTPPHHQGVQPQSWGQVQMASGPLMPYSGFDEALQRWGPSSDIPATRDLRWQRDVKGDTQKIKQFQEVVGGLQEFRTYLLMKPGSAFVTVLHSPMKFVVISEATQHLQGRYVGFVGDRTSTKDPTPVVLPQQSTWKW